MTRDEMDPAPAGKHGAGSGDGVSTVGAENSSVPFHPLADIFPMLDAGGLQELVDDIRSNGLREPITLYEGAILDGRNRYAACVAAGVAPAFATYAGDDPIAYVWSLNAARRHLTPSQRAACALDVEARYAEQARERQGTRTDLGNIPERFPESQGDARDKAAAVTGANPHYITDAKAIARADPEMLDAVKFGAKTIPQAKRELKEREREARRETNRETIASAPTIETAISSARFATIVVDPPWDWGDEGDVDQLGRARPTYATMTIDQLLAFPLGERADTDAHLYLWITNRSLPKGFALLDAWGFRYITCLTWCKPSFGMGNYFRGQTEHVLFGVRGSQPLRRKDVGTWFLAQRGGEHSAKPDEFYRIVESCSPGPYLDVFARKERPGWTAWGGEL